MTHAHFYALVCPNMMLIRGDQVLLLKRADWAPIWPNTWHLPTGRIEVGESPLQAIIRETYEEVGVRCNPKLGTVVTYQGKHFQNPEVDYKDISLFFVCDDFKEEPMNKEPRLHPEMDWFSYQSLPKPIIPNVARAIEQYFKGIAYGEMGFGCVS